MDKKKEISRKDKRHLLPKQEQMRLKSYEEFAHPFDTLGDYKKAMVRSYRETVKGQDEKGRVTED